MTAFTKHAKSTAAFMLAAALLLSLGNVVFAAPPATSYTPQVRAIDTNDSSGVTMSDFMTYSEMLDYMVNEKGIPFSIAASTFPATRAVTRSGTYRVLSVTLTVENRPSYTPTLDFYCEVSVGDGVWGIMNIYSVQMNRSSNGLVKQFDGDVQVWLRSAERIEYIVNGDFYNTGTTTSSNSGSIDLNIGDYGKITFGASSTTTSNWYGYCYCSAIKKFT